MTLTARAANRDELTCCEPLTSEAITPAQAGELARMFKALSDPSRVRLISLIAASRDREACVCDLTEPLGLSQPTVSHHLRILMEAGILSRTKRGTWAYYTLVPDELDRLSRLLVTTA